MTQSIHHPVSHPAWCDPRVCEEYGENTLHAAPPAVYRLDASDTVVSVGLVQIHDAPVQVRISVEDEASVRPTPSTLIAAEGVADANDLRILSALLLGTAERVENLEGGAR